MDKYKQLNRLDLLAKKPIFMGKKFVSNDASYGYYKNDHTSERGNAYLLEYLRKYHEEIWFMEIIEEIKNYLAENTDLVDAIVACEILHRNIVEKNKKETEKHIPNVRQIPVLKFVNGRYVRVWEKVGIK